MEEVKNDQPAAPNFIMNAFLNKIKAAQEEKDK